MCNPKPGKRCFSDAKTALSTKLTQLNELSKDFNSIDLDTASDEETNRRWDLYAKIQKTSDEIERRKVLLYSTATAQEDKEAAIAEVRKLEAGLSPDVKKNLEGDEERLHLTGAYLSRFQALADDARKDVTGDNQQVAIARKMHTEVFPAADKKASEQLRTKYHERFRDMAKKHGVYSAEYEKVQTDMDKEVYCLSEAYNYSRRDAREVLAKDIQNNSKSLTNSISGVRTDYKKNFDGSFTVTTAFSINAKDYATAMERAESSFKKDGVQITSAPCNTPGTYNFTAQDVYQGEEKYQDVVATHKNNFVSTWAGKYDDRVYAN